MSASVCQVDTDERARKTRRLRQRGTSRVYVGRTSVAVAVLLIILVSANDVLSIQDMNPAFLSM